LTTTELATKAATIAAPELAIPLQLASQLLAQRGRPPAATSEMHGDVLLVPPPEHPVFLRLSKQKIHVRTRKGIRIVTVEPERGLTAGEVVVVSLVLGAAYELSKISGGIASKLTPQKNALGIPFGNLFPGGGTDPLNYLFP
jgi:hypothetical protein